MIARRIVARRIQELTIKRRKIHMDRKIHSEYPEGADACTDK